MVGPELNLLPQNAAEATAAPLAALAPTQNSCTPQVHLPVQVNQGADLALAKHRLLLAQHPIQALRNRPTDWRSDPHQTAHHGRSVAANAEAIARADGLWQDLTCEGDKRKRNGERAHTRQENVSMSLST